MRGLVLNWDSIHAIATDEAHRNKRARIGKNPKLKDRLSRADHEIYCQKIEHLTMLFYRAKHDGFIGPVDIREAWIELTETRGRGCYFA